MLVLECLSRVHAQSRHRCSDKAARDEIVAAQPGADTGADSQQPAGSRRRNAASMLRAQARVSLKITLQHDLVLPRWGLVLRGRGGEDPRGPSGHARAAWIACEASS